MESKVGPKLWTVVMVTGAIFGCIGLIGAAVIGVLPNFIKLSPEVVNVPSTVVVTQIVMATQVVQPTPTNFAVKDCILQTNWTPPNPSENGEWIYDCLSSSTGNWVGQTEQWKAENWEHGLGQSEIINIVVPHGATTMGIGCNPCTVVAPSGATISPQCLSQAECFGSFKPNASLNVSVGEVYRVQIFGQDTCPSRKEAVPPCPPEVYIWFNLPSPLTIQQATRQPTIQVTSPVSSGLYICGEPAFNGDLQTTDPLFLRPEGYLLGWISSDPSTIVLPDGTTKVFETQYVLIVEDLPSVQIKGVQRQAGEANTWGCWYSADLSTFIAEDAKTDFCTKKAAGNTAMMYRVSSAGFEELGTTATISCP